MGLTRKLTSEEKEALKRKKEQGAKEHVCEDDPCPIEGPGCYTQDKVNAEIMADYWLSIQ